MTDWTMGNRSKLFGTSAILHIDIIDVCAQRELLKVSIANGCIIKLF